MRVLGSVQRLRSIRTRRSLLPPPATGPGDPRWEASWRHLFEVYEPAMRRYVAALLEPMTAGRVAPEDAADVVQDYLATCLEKGWLEREARDIRCFRAYLQTQLKRFTFTWVRDRRAKKRNPPNPLSDGGLATAPTEGPDPAAALDAGLVEVVLRRARSRLREGNEVYAEIIDDLLRTEGTGSGDLAQRIGHDPKDLPLLRHRARRRFAALFADELRATVREDDAFADLLQRLEAHLP